ncbi:hypothetical protein [Paratractidigestivibacter faecalis]|uniref:hypothetical protein n=1 Tax=Paratractidigestivibacter faecalis TaxID=2292441 RepID=UPI003A933178
MPAIITHHIFGEDVLRTLPAGMVEGEEEVLAFLLGNQGPTRSLRASLRRPRWPCAAGAWGTPCTTGAW